MSNFYKKNNYNINIMLIYFYNKSIINKHYIYIIITQLVRKNTIIYYKSIIYNKSIINNLFIMLLEKY